MEEGGAFVAVPQLSTDYQPNPQPNSSPWKALEMATEAVPAVWLRRLGDQFTKVCKRGRGISLAWKMSFHQGSASAVEALRSVVTPCNYGIASRGKLRHDEGKL